MSKRTESDSEIIHVDVDLIHIECGITPSRNEMDRLNYSRNLGEIADIKRGCYYAVMAGLTADQRQICHDHLYLYAIRCGKRTLDDDNCIGGMKWLVDATIRVGLIPDDSPRHLTWIGIDQRTPRQWGGFRGMRTHLLMHPEKSVILEHLAMVDALSSIVE